MSQYHKPHTVFSFTSETGEFKTHILRGFWSEQALRNRKNRYKASGAAQAKHVYYYTHRCLFLAALKIFEV